MATLSAMFKILNGYSGPLTQIIQKTDKATNKILQASGATDKFNKKLEATEASANKGSSGLSKFLSVAAMIAGAVKGADISDTYMNTAARLDLINDGLQTQAELQDKIFAAADRAKGSYTSMAGAVSKLGLLAGDAFKSNDETIAFTELMQKSFKLGGADTGSQQSAMLQLTQAMASGRLQGDELTSISENAPILYDAIAKYMGVSKGELKELGAESKITANIIKNALFMAGDDINDKFSDLPNTFASYWNDIKNGGLSAFSGLIEKVNKLINTDQFMSFINKVIAGFNMIADAVGGVIDFVIGNWPAIKTILEIVAVVYMAAIIAKIWETVTALAAQATAWLMAYWPLLLIIAVIGLVIMAARDFGATWEEIFGAIGGIVGVAVAIVYNVFTGLWNGITDIVQSLYNIFAGFAEFFANVWHDPIGSASRVFNDFVANVIDLLKGLASVIDQIFGTGISGALENFKGFIIGNTGDLAGEAKYKIDRVDLSENKLDRMDYTDTWEKGSSIYGNVTGKWNELLDKITNNEDTGTKQYPAVVEGTGSKGNVNVSMDKEDIGYLRDLAEREFVNKFSTATLAPKISVKFTGPISKEADTDAMYSRMSRILQEQIAVAAEGVHT
ncbi:MAG TPA: tape measure protein [Clostridiales bacterium]|nr:tape measure protein [Clostridiales bacterium]